MKIKNGDFVAMEYTGLIKDTQQVFDTTDESIAKKNKLYSKSAIYGPKVICIGRGYILKAIEDSIIDKEENTEYSLDINQEQAFGKKDSSLMKTIPVSALQKQKINPFPGLQLNIGGLLGLVRSVNSGRTLIDFNHPLAGKDLIYNIKINSIVNEPEKKIEGLCIALLNIKKDAFTIERNDTEFTLKIKQKLPAELKDMLSKEISEAIPAIKIKIL